MMTPFFFGVVGVLGLIYLWIGKRASRNLTTCDDYYLMNRSLSVVPLALSLLATQLGGGTLLAVAGEAYNQGWVVILYPLGVVGGLCALGLGFGAKLQKLGLSTIAEVFEKIYGSRTQRYGASILSIASLFFILTAQAIAARMFFASMGLDQPWIFIVCWSVLIAYTVVGGLKAVVNTDILQALFILAVLAMTVAFADSPTIKVSVK